MASPSKFFPDNSTCTFCDRVSFVEVKKSWLSKPRETLVADTPDEWFEYLARKQTLGVRLVHQRQNDPRISDRMSAGFVGGGGFWALGVRYPASTDYWRARWEVWNQNAPEQRIWRVTYGLVAKQPATSIADQNRSEALVAFKAALARIHAFSLAHDCGGFTGCFARAMQSLTEMRAVHGYHKDLYVPGILSKSSQAMLDAAQSAWVFGGMGSWTDMGFDGDDGKEYEEASEQLFTALNDAVCAAANESDAL
jgi:hypothetical protein